MDQATQHAFEKLNASIERGFSGVAEDIAEIRDRMATKDDLAALRTELKSDIASVRTELKADIAEQVAGIESDLKTIRRDLNDLIEKVENITGYRKEIDHAFERISTIEKHLGIYKQAA